MDKNIFISDQFNTWKLCKKRYYFKYIKGLNLPEFENNFKLGKSVHALINYHLRGFSVENLLENTDENIKNTWNTIKNHSILNNKVIVTEWTFNSKIKGLKYWLNGRIDAVFYDENQKKYIIADWKTGQNIPKDPDNSFQCMMYLYSFYNARKDLRLEFEQKDLIFEYIKISDKVEIYKVAYSKEKEQDFEKVFVNMINEIEAEKDFKPMLPCSMRNCQYKNLCIKS